MHVQAEPGSVPVLSQAWHISSLIKEAGRAEYLQRVCPRRQWDGRTQTQAKLTLGDQTLQGRNPCPQSILLSSAVHRVNHKGFTNPTYTV